MQVYTDGSNYYVPQGKSMVKLQLVRVPVVEATKPTPKAAKPKAAKPTKRNVGHTRVPKHHADYDLVRNWRVGQPCPWDGAAHVGSEPTGRKGKRRHYFACRAQGKRHYINRYRPGM